MWKYTNHKVCHTWGFELFYEIDAELCIIFFVSTFVHYCNRRAANKAGFRLFQDPGNGRCVKRELRCQTCTRALYDVYYSPLVTFALTACTCTLIVCGYWLVVLHGVRGGLSKTRVL